MSEGSETPVRSMNAEEDGSVIGYMCFIDWECELGAASGGNTIYPSIEDLKRHHTCWETCGIVEVRVNWSKTILPWPEPSFDTLPQTGETTN